MKKAHGTSTQKTSLPCTHDPAQVLEPVVILARTMVRRCRVVATKVLVHWAFSLLDDDSWEFLHDLQLRFPHLHLGNKVVSEGNVTGRTYLGQIEELCQGIEL